MSVWLRIVLVCLLALALPAQGIAAAVMIHCGDGTQRSQSVPSLHAGHGGHGGDAAKARPSTRMAEAAHAPHHDDAQSHDHAAASADDPPAQDSHSHLGTAKCSACASCCSAAALPVFVLDLAVPAAFTQWQPERLQTLIGFVTDGPDRPPRSFLA